MGLIPASPYLFLFSTGVEGCGIDSPGPLLFLLSFAFSKGRGIDSPRPHIFFYLISWGLPCPEIETPQQHFIIFPFLRISPDPTLVQAPLGSPLLIYLLRYALVRSWVWSLQTSPILFSFSRSKFPEIICSLFTDSGSLFHDFMHHFPGDFSICFLYIG